MRHLVSLAVVPRAVQFRVLLYVLGGLSLLALPLCWPAESVGALVGKQAGGSGLGFGERGFWLCVEAAVVPLVAWVLWCRLPLGFFLVPKTLRGPLLVNGPSLSFSFDDGPTPGLTDAILDLLHRHDVRASFFVLLHKAERHPQLISRIVRQGHVLGLHGADHRLPFFSSRDTLRHRLENARVRLEQLAGQKVTLYRPSHGVRTPALLGAMRAAGLLLCMWDHGIWDTDAPSGQSLLARLQTLGAAKLPRLVLLHDGKGDDPDRPKHAEALVWALDRWLSSQHRKSAEP